MPSRLHGLQPCDVYSTQWPLLCLAAVNKLIAEQANADKASATPIGLIVGVAVGAAVATVLVTSAIVFLVRRKFRQQPAASPYAAPPAGPPPHWPAGHHQSSAHMVTSMPPMGPYQTTQQAAMDPHLGAVFVPGMQPLSHQPSAFARVGEVHSSPAGHMRGGPPGHLA